MIRVKQARHAGLIKSKEEIGLMRKACRRLAFIRDELAARVRPGVSTKELDDAARTMIEAEGDKPAFLGYQGYPATICASINEEVVHGIPSAKRILRQGDLISIDLGLVREGFVADSAVTVPVGVPGPETARLIEVTREALRLAIEAARTGNRLGDIGWAVQSYVESQGFSVVREYTGHGIGREMHEEPKVPNFGKPGDGQRLEVGMTLALEPMVNVGGWRTKALDDGWTVVTLDGKPSAHFEHTIAVTGDGAEILTTV